VVGWIRDKAKGRRQKAKDRKQKGEEKKSEPLMGMMTLI